LKSVRRIDTEELIFVEYFLRSERWWKE